MQILYTLVIQAKNLLYCTVSHSHLFIMTPSTPPRARGNSSSSKAASQPQVSYNKQKKANFFETPHKSSLPIGPVTPSTVTQLKRQPVLEPPTSIFTASFRGLESPEYTPHRDTNKRPLTFGSNNEFHDISKVLFPGENNEELESAVLLPPTRTTSTIDDPFRMSDDMMEEQEPNIKLAKQVPGTPSHKVITYEMAEQWHNTVDATDSLDEEDTIITEQTVENPFVSDRIVTANERLIRKNILLQENPELPNKITYINKQGKPVRQRTLSEQDKELYKPKRLFAKELDEVERKR